MIYKGLIFPLFRFVIEFVLPFSTTLNNGHRFRRRFISTGYHRSAGFTHGGCSAGLGCWFGGGGLWRGKKGQKGESTAKIITSIHPRGHQLLISLRLKKEKILVRRRWVPSTVPAESKCVSRLEARQTLSSALSQFASRYPVSHHSKWWDVYIHMIYI